MTEGTGGVLAQDSFPVRAGRGLGYAAEGLGRLFRDWRTFLLALVPAAITLGVFVGLGVLALVFGRDLVERVVPIGDWAAVHGAAAATWFALRVAARVLFYALTALAWVAALLTLFLGVSSAVAAPFNELLSEKIEEEATGVRPPAFSARRFAGDAGLAVAHALLSTAILVSGSVALALVGWLVPVLGTVVSFVGGLVLTGFFLALAGIDPAASRRRWSYAQKVRLVTGNLWAMGGFAATGMLLLAVPLLNLFALPALVAGGTRLFVALEGPGRAVD